MRWRMVWVLASLLVGAVAGVQAEPVEVTAQEVRAMMDAGDVQVINPLSAIEFRDLAIEGSLNVPAHRLAESLPADKATRLVFYCLGPK